MKKLSGFCTICGVWWNSLHRDHVTPKFKGGMDNTDNIQLLCPNCHQEKTSADFTGISKEMGGRDHRARKTFKKAFYEYIATLE